MKRPGLRPTSGAHHPGRPSSHRVGVTGIHETQDQMWTLLAHEVGDNAACHRAPALVDARQRVEEAT